MPLCYGLKGMKKTLFITVTLFLSGCNNKEQSLLALIKEKDLEIEQLKSRSKKPQKATLKDGTKILAYDWEIEPKEIFNIPIGNSYYEGPEDAKVTIIEWMDYQ